MVRCSTCSCTIGERGCNALLVLLGAEAGLAVGQLHVELSGTCNNLDALAGRHVVCNLREEKESATGKKERKPSGQSRRRVTCSASSTHLGAVSAVVHQEHLEVLK